MDTNACLAQAERQGLVGAWPTREGCSDPTFFFGGTTMVRVEEEEG